MVKCELKNVTQDLGTCIYVARKTSRENSLVALKGHKKKITIQEKVFKECKTF